MYRYSLLFKWKFVFILGIGIVLIFLIDKLLTAWDYGEIVFGVFFILIRFPTVNHDILLDKLYEYAIKCMAHDYKKIFL